jgi:predicted nuclease with TOPRIM domain
VELTQLRRLYETLQLEISTVLESLNQLRESPDYELCQLSEKKPNLLDELAAERAKVLEKESAELEKEAKRLAGEIEELAGELPTGIG